MTSNLSSDSGKSDRELCKKRFLAAYEVMGSVQEAARWARVPRQYHNQWLEQDLSYQAKFKEAQARAAQTLEDEAVGRAVTGVRNPVLHHGKPVYVEGRPVYEIRNSDRLLERLLEANNPERFKRRDTANIAKLLKTDPSKWTEEQLEIISDHLIRQAVGDDPASVEEAKRQLDAGVPAEKIIEAIAVEPRSTEGHDAVTEKVQSAPASSACGNKRPRGLSGW